MADELASGIAAYRAGRYENAVRDLGALLDQPDGPAAGLACLGGALFRIGAYARSVRCWERLLERSWMGDTRVQLRINRARAAYMAARTEVQAGRFGRALELMEAYREMHKGEPRALGLVAGLQRLAALDRERAALDLARRCADASQWPEAVDQLARLPTRLDEMHLVDPR